MRRRAAKSNRTSLLTLLLFFALILAGCGHKSAKAPQPAAQPKPGASAQQDPETPRIPPVVLPPAVSIGAEPKPVLPALPAGPSLPGPPVRISLTIPGPEVRVASTGSFVLVEKVPEAPRITITGEIRVHLEHPQGEAAEIYRIQVASLSSQEAAERLGRELNEQFSLPTIVRENPAAGTRQVRIGSFYTRKEAQDFAAATLSPAGYRDAFVVREDSRAAEGVPTLALRGPENLFRISRSGYLFLPGSKESHLRVNGRPYRGVLDVSLGRNGRITVVNELGIEEYLLGVVPMELSPTTYPEEMALQAQAIAARTYALKNLGRYRNAGYDLTDDTMTQVYGGVAAEKIQSNEAVRQTSGIAIYYQGSLIDAMYSSTCGGRTEDFSNVFDGSPVPYLTSVSCTVDGSQHEEPEANVVGSSHPEGVLLADDGSPVNRELALAQILGLTSGERLSQEFLRAGPGRDEIRTWLDRARLLAGKKDPENAVTETGITSRAGFLRYAAERFFGIRDIQRRISDSDASYYLGNLGDGSEVPASCRRALAYLVQRNLWHPYPDNTIRPELTIQSSDALALLTRWILSERPETLRSATAADPGPGSSNDGRGGSLGIKRGSRTEHVPLAPDLHLFRTDGKRSTPVAQLRLIGNERLAFHQNSNGQVDFLEVELSATGASSDRFSPVASWKVTFSRADVSAKLRSLAGNVGEILDLKPARLGNSGRVVQLEIVGSRGSVIVNGYKARNALGLRDTLYTLTRASSGDGGFASFTFDGRGWGHGVGLCQTGAVGMARAGRSAEEILKTYYQGVELRKAY
ncbi:MAG: SpoIID/LytB domain protein [Acidobacteria bacterium]|nr:SpoIID/LytB domain protein [Acidobacteriota bacterium]